MAKKYSLDFYLSNNTIESVEFEVPEGEKGKTAYEVACDNGFKGTEKEWLESLAGEDGKSGVYVGAEEPQDDSNVWIDPEGKETDLRGKSAYEIALDHGFEGSEEEWLESLVGKDYVLTETDKTEIAEEAAALVDTSGFVPRNQGSSNVGKILVVGTDGMLTLVDMPEGGASGDVTGTLDESNNILLSGNLASGTYTLSFVNEDGTYSGAGTLEVVEIPKPEEPAEPTNWIKEVGYTAGLRISLSAGAEREEPGYECTGYIPIKRGDVLKIENIDMTEETPTNITVFDIDKQPYRGGASSGNYGVTLHNLFVTNGSQEGNAYTATLTGDIANSFGSGMAFIRISSKSITDESVVNIKRDGVWL